MQRQKCFGLCVAAMSAVSLAGPINPPTGPVASTPGPEPRVAINGVNTPGDAECVFRITQSGSYYFAGNLTGVSGKSGIVVAAPYVTIDMNGFSLIGVPITSTHGIRIDNVPAVAQSTFTLLNGTIRAWGQRAVFSDDLSRVCRIERVNAIGCVIGFSVISAVFEECNASKNSGNGFILNGAATLSGCIAQSNTSHGFRSAGLGPVVFSKCLSRGNSESGLELGASNSTVEDSIVTGNGVYGISVFGNSLIRGNTVENNAIRGITVFDGRSLIEANRVTGGEIGIGLDVSGQRMIGNDVRAASVSNYDVQGDNHEIDLLITQLPAVVGFPCAISLAGTLTGVSGQHGIAVSADNVTIDLGGHALVGAAGSLSGIHASVGVKGLAVRNGTARDWGRSGIDAGAATGARFSDLVLSGNGGANVFPAAGLVMGSNAIVSDCIANGNLGSVSIPGFLGTDGNTITNCRSDGNAGDGFSLRFGNRIESCSARANNGDGIETAAGGFVLNCHLDSNGNGANVGANIFVTDGASRIEGNSCIGGDFGIRVAGGGNVIVKNSSRGSANNYGGIVGGNDVGPIGSAAAATSPWANIQY